MDPITAAAKQFLADLEMLWSPHPGVPIPRGSRAVRLVVEPSERSELRKALRWLEWSPENRRPVVLFEDAFEDEPRYLRALVAKTSDDWEAMRKGFIEDGVRLASPVRPAEAAMDTKTARAYLDAAADRMAETLDGLFIALVPKRVTDPKAYCRTVAAIVAPPLGAALRFGALDVPGAALGALLPGEARFELDRAKLFAFLKQLGPKTSEGPVVQLSARLLCSKGALEKEPAPRNPSQHAGETLRVLLLDAGQALSNSKANLAIQKFRAAQRLCRAGGLVAEECATGLGLGSAYLAAGDEQAALASYKDAMQHALAAELRPLAAQAMLGIAGIHFGKGRYAEARTAYETSAHLTMDVPPLAQEAERMQKQCRELERAQDGEPRGARSHNEIRIPH